MATLKLYRNGYSLYKPSGMTNPNPVKRADTIGWSTRTSSRLKNWLLSVDANQLSGFGLSFTLTVRDCPPTPDDWSASRNAFIKRLFRDGCIRMQWLTEWQERGVPHMHGIAYFTAEYWPDRLINHWLQVVSKKYGASKKGQDCKGAYDEVTWLKYLAKHSVRSVNNYQRSPENIPRQWDKTGRMWGYRGDWSMLDEPMEFQLDDKAYYAFRRIANKHHIADIRHRLNEYRSQATQIVSKRRSLELQYSGAVKYLQCNHEPTSRVKAAKQWMPLDEQTRLTIWLGSQGHRIHASHPDKREAGQPNKYMDV